MQDVTSWRSPLYYGGLMRWAQVQGLTTIAWAQGIGPFRARWMGAWTRHCLHKCQLISVRDDRSAQLLQNWGFAPVVAPDPVWALTSAVPAGLWDLPAPRVAVCLRAHPLLTPRRLEVLSLALQSFQQATQTYILLVPFQPKQDLPIAEILASRLPPPVRCIWRETNPRLLKGLFRGVEMTIAMRLHGVIMAVSEGCRCFALSYDPKVRAVMHALDLEGCDLANLPDQPAQITKDWLDTYANGNALDEIQISALIDRAKIHQELLFSLDAGQ
jgi:polysaccharide pyruvyl transferase CsaB